MVMGLMGGRIFALRRPRPSSRHGRESAGVFWAIIHAPVEWRKPFRCVSIIRFCQLKWNGYICSDGWPFVLMAKNAERNAGDYVRKNVDLRY